MELIHLKCVSVLLLCSTVKLFPKVGTNYCLVPVIVIIVPEGDSRQRGGLVRSAEEANGVLSCGQAVGQEALVVQLLHTCAPAGIRWGVRWVEDLSTPPHYKDIQ